MNLALFFQEIVLTGDISGYFEGLAVDDAIGKAADAFDLDWANSFFSLASGFGDVEETLSDLPLFDRQLYSKIFEHCAYNTTAIR